MIRPSPIVNHSHHAVRPNRCCPNLKKGKWFPIEKTIAGDAPKEFVAVYEPDGGCRRTKMKSWPRFIAKVGHKWYPIESVTEHLITRIGQGLGLDIADSRLAFLSGQLRFLSRYFLSERDSLVHGAEIFSTYLEKGIEYVEGIESKNQSPIVFDYLFAKTAIERVVGVGHIEIIRKFHQMLAFDALIGNNDRHFYNWGVVYSIRRNQVPFFSPIFDTARALFWNLSEGALSRKFAGKELAAETIVRYSEKSYSKIGTIGGGKVNYFQLLEAIIKHNQNAVGDLNLLADQKCDPVEIVQELFRGEFRGLISPLRQACICRLLEYRSNRLRKVFGMGTENGH